MARLIDADALKRQIQEAYCAECDDYNGIRCRACSIDDALFQVDAAPTIAAIPVEWLKGLMLSTEDDVDKMEFAWIMREWREEQEAR